MKKLVIILDPAHGSNVAGKCSPDGRHKEYKFSRDVLSRVYGKLVSLGFRVEYTNTSEKEIGLLKRQENANKIKVEPGQTKFLFSLHNDAAGDGSKWMRARGFSFYTSVGNTKSDIFGNIIFDQLREDFYPLKARMWKKSHPGFEKNFTVLMGKTYYAVLLEWLFQDNKQDVENLVSPATQEDLVNSLVKAFLKIEAYLNQ